MLEERTQRESHSERSKTSRGDLLTEIGDVESPLHLLTFLEGGLIISMVEVIKPRPEKVNASPKITWLVREVEWGCSLLSTQQWSQRVAPLEELGLGAGTRGGMVRGRGRSRC